MLLAALVAYAAASLLHHAHNAEFLGEYPGMPAWLSRAGVYGAWGAVTALGVLAYLLLSRGRPGTGLLLLAVYATYGFGSLVHYALAPPSAHGAAMNATIALEAGTAAWLLATVIRTALSSAFK